MKIFLFILQTFVYILHLLLSLISFKLFIFLSEIKFQKNYNENILFILQMFFSLHFVFD